MFTEGIARLLISVMGQTLFLAWTIFLLFVVPAVLVILFGYALVKRNIRSGVQSGFAAGSWASLCWLTLPYIGGFPNLPTLLFLTKFLGINHPVDALWQELLIHAVNLSLWPGGAWAILSVRNRWLTGTRA